MTDRESKSDSRRGLVIAILILFLLTLGMATYSIIQIEEGKCHCGERNGDHKVTFVDTKDVSLWDNWAVKFVAHGGHVEYPGAPTYDGYTFRGWYDESDRLWDFDTDIVESDIMLYSKWGVIGDPEPETYTVTFDSMGGSSVPRITEVGYKSRISAPPNPVYGNKAFRGWYKEDTLINKWDFSADAVRSDITLYAKWGPPVYSVKFETNGGPQVSPIGDMQPGSYASPPTDPVWPMHVFQGWYKDQGLTDRWYFNVDTVDCDVTLYAKWKVQYKVTFDYQNATGGNSVRELLLCVGDAYTLPSPLRYLGPIGSYTFEGWYDQIGGVNAIKSDRFASWGDDPVWTYGGDVTLHAYWEGTPGIVYPGGASWGGTVATSNDPITLIIQEWYRGTKVTEIGVNGFAHDPARGKLVGIYIPETVTVIGSGAFKGCVGLTEVDLPSGLKELKGMVNWVGYGAFEGCTGLARVAIPASLEAIGDRTFYGCSKLASITLPSTLTKIGASAFHYCSLLNNVVIPSGVKRIENNTFSSCSSLTSVTLHDDIAFIGQAAFYNTKIAGNMDMPQSLTDIGANAFYNTKLTGISLHGSLRTIGSNAFRYCTLLSSVTIENGLTDIGESAFGNCTALKALVLPDSVRTIGMGAFESSGLESITLSANLTSLGGGVAPNVGNAFKNCASLKAIDIPASLGRLENNTFEGCVSLETVTLHSGLATMGNNAFKGCVKLAAIALPDSLTSIGESAFSGCAMLAAIVLPEGFTSIGNSAFLNCAQLASAYLPDSLLSIGKEAFKGCAALKSAYISQNVTSVGKDAFRDCGFTAQSPLYVHTNANYLAWTAGWEGNTADFAMVSVRP